MLIFHLKKWKNSPEMWKSSIFLYIFSLLIQLYIAKVPIGSGSGGNFPDPAPTKKVRIRPDPAPEPWK